MSAFGQYIPVTSLFHDDSDSSPPGLRVARVTEVAPWLIGVRNNTLADKTHACSTPVNGVERHLVSGVTFNTAT